MGASLLVASQLLATGERRALSGQEEDVFNNWPELDDPCDFYGHFARDLIRLMLLSR